MKAWASWVKNGNIAKKMKKMIIKDHKGATTVEFAIALPLLILFLFGIIEFGLLLYNKHLLTNACREGSRAGIVARTNRLDNPDIKNIIINYATSYLVSFGSDTLDPDDITILPIDIDGSFDPNTERCISFGCDLRVEVSYDYDFLVLSALGFGPITLEAVSVMRME